MKLRSVRTAVAIAAVAVTVSLAADKDLRRLTFSWLWKAVAGAVDANMAVRKTQVVTALASMPPSGQLVEIGCGLGGNFKYYPRGVSVACVEPNQHFHDGIQVEARRCGVNATVLGDPASSESLPVMSPIDMPSQRRCR